MIATATFWDSIILHKSYCLYWLVEFQVLIFNFFLCVLTSKYKPAVHNEIQIWRHCEIIERVDLNFKHEKWICEKGILNKNLWFFHNNRNFAKDINPWHTRIFLKIFLLNKTLMNKICMEDLKFIRVCHGKQNFHSKTHSIF